MNFGAVNSEGFILCNELKIQAKYGSEKAQSKKEMGAFYEAFAITKIKAPSFKAKRAKKPAKYLKEQINPQRFHLQVLS